mmetsp:Transcript_23929/g.94139  ORF Transcript_23929/g.94139 Transcript_23929/m.94139 type:complete len:90 (+) Transcript_23929:2106-2375(+)
MTGNDLVKGKPNSIEVREEKERIIARNIAFLEKESGRSLEKALNPRPRPRLSPFDSPFEAPKANGRNFLLLLGACGFLYFWTYRARTEQ